MTVTIAAPASTPPTMTGTVTELQHKLEPAVFFSTGNTRDVLIAWGEAVVKEELRDCPAIIGKIGFAPASGALVVNAPSFPVDQKRYALAYCWHAFQQLFERTGKATPPVNCPRGAAAQTAYWASNDLRARIFGEVRDTGHKDKTAVIRIGRDVHGSNPTGRFYARGTVSEKHSAESGDDLRLLHALMGPLVDGEFGDAFASGRASLRRDPQGMTTGWFSAAMTPSGLPASQTSATLAVRVENSETGCSSLRASMYLSFAWAGDTVAGEQPTFANVAIPVAKSSSRTIHRGNPVAAAVSKLGQHLALSMAWAPGAVAKLAATEIHSDELTATEALIVAELQTRGLQTRGAKPSKSEAREQLDAAFTLAEKYSTKGKALNLVIVLALLKFEQRASALVETVAGGI